MKLLRFIAVLVAIGIGLWGGTVHAQSQQSRIVSLDCVDGNPAVYCGFDGGRGQLKINRWEIGSSASAGNSPIVPADGDPHPLAELNVVIPCQYSNLFYALYIQLNNDGYWLRIFSFNTDCASWRYHTELLLEIALPDIDPNRWFDTPLSAKIVWERDDGLDGQLGYVPILVGSD